MINVIFKLLPIFIRALDYGKNVKDNKQEFKANTPKYGIFYQLNYLSFFFFLIKTELSFFTKTVAHIRIKVAHKFNKFGYPP